MGLQSSPWNHDSFGQVTINLAVWPPGCWEHFQRLYPSQDDEPYAASNSPIAARPGTITGRWGGGDHWWSFDHNSDLNALGSELAHFCVLDALPWARKRLCGDSSITALLAGDSTTNFNLRYAIATSFTQDRDAATIRPLLDRLRRAWEQHPFPASLPAWIAEQEERLRSPND